MSEDFKDVDDEEFVPRWLTDTEKVAPCPCGEIPDEEMVLIRGEAGLIRMIHIECLPLFGLDAGEDDEDQDEIF